MNIYINYKTLKSNFNFCVPHILISNEEIAINIEIFDDKVLPCVQFAVLAARSTFALLKYKSVRMESSGGSGAAQDERSGFEEQKY